MCSLHQSEENRPKADAANNWICKFDQYGTKNRAHVADSRQHVRRNPAFTKPERSHKIAATTKECKMHLGCWLEGIYKFGMKFAGPLAHRRERPWLLTVGVLYLYIAPLPPRPGACGLALSLADLSQATLEINQTHCFCFVCFRWFLSACPGAAGRPVCTGLGTGERFRCTGVSRDRF